MGRISDKLRDIAERLAGKIGDGHVATDTIYDIQENPKSFVIDDFDRPSQEEREFLEYFDEPEGRNDKATSILDSWPKPPPRARVWGSDVLENMVGQRRALLLGCSEYKHMAPLSSTLADVDAVAEILGDAHVGCFDTVDRIECTKDRPADALKAEILDWLASASDGDTLFFFFSGHAFSTGLDDGLFLAVETTDTSVAASAIDLESVLDAFSASRAPSLLVVLDCCQSGAVTGQLARTLQPRRLRGDTDYDTNFGYGGLRILTSSTIGEYSFEGSDGGLSPFTRLFVDGLRSGAADTDRDGIVSDVEIFSYIDRSRQVIETQAGSDAPKLKTPTHSVLDGRTPYLLGLNRFVVEDVTLAKLPEQHVEKYVALKTVVDLVGQCEPISFMVMCFRYDFVEVGGFAMASGLTVSATHTPFVAVSPDGLLCDTFFSRDMVPETLAAQQPGERLVRTRLLVPWDEILLISGKDIRSRKQWNVYVPEGNIVKNFID